MSRADRADFWRISRSSDHPRQVLRSRSELLRELDRLGEAEKEGWNPNAAAEWMMFNGTSAFRVGCAGRYDPSMIHHCSCCFKMLQGEKVKMTSFATSRPAAPFVQARWPFASRPVDNMMPQMAGLSLGAPRITEPKSHFDQRDSN